MKSKYDLGGDRMTKDDVGLITLERVLGTLVTLFGIWLLLIGIPINVIELGDEVPSPRLFPQIGAWIFVVGGFAQILFVKGNTRLPELRQFARYVLVSCLLLLMVLLMENFGYIVGAMALMAALMVVVFERRLLWVSIAVIAVPITVWLLFEKVLERPLP